MLKMLKVDIWARCNCIYGIPDKETIRRGKAESQTDLFPVDRAPRNANMIHLPRPNRSIGILLPVLYFLEWISDRIILPQEYLLPLLRRLVLDKHLLRILLQELPDESWIPQLACYSEVFAAPP